MKTMFRSNLILLLLVNLAFASVSDNVPEEETNRVRRRGSSSGGGALEKKTQFMEEADKTSDWYDHFCFVGMGDHYLQFDYTPDQACDSVLPFQILYDQGVITGFVWQHIATLPGDKWEHPDAMAVSAIIDRPPTCITDLLDYPGLSTMHHYFYNYPWLTGCPFNQARAGLRKMMHMGT